MLENEHLAIYLDARKDSKTVKPIEGIPTNSAIIMA